MSPQHSVMMPPIDDDLQQILAKGRVKGQGQESLVAHTWQVLSRLADQRRLRPELAVQVGDPRLWNRLYWGTFLHDFGKAADGFQEMLAGKKSSWGYRHEALSLVFVDWLFPANHQDREAVIAVIGCHHKDADEIGRDYKRRTDYPEEDSAGKIVPQISEQNRRRLYRWLREYGWQWAEALGLAGDLNPATIAVLPAEAEALALIQPTTLHRAINDLGKLMAALKQPHSEKAHVIGAVWRGLILTADHAGSAHSDPFPGVEIEPEKILAPIYQANRAPHPHQLAARNAPAGSALLISPTGSGKTEAALLWAARQAELSGTPPRLFYTLPYQASMNAMKQRLEKVFPKQGDQDIIGLQHGRALLALYRQAMNGDGSDSREAAAYAHTQKELAKLHYFPVHVFSPYQMLKAPFRLKGFEALLTDLYGGFFIFDEIHAYDPQRLAMIVCMVGALADRFAARFLIMTATLPPLVRRALEPELPNLHVIQASEQTFADFQRHKVHVLNGDLLANLDLIVADADAGKSVLVCCNTVQRAMEVQRALSERLSGREEDLILVHSRFASEDRLNKEAAIQERVGITAGNKQSKPIVVATQVVEVSLNIDLDTLYSEAAPLEALLQRFGRVNRGRGKGAPLCDVYVVREQPEVVELVYKPVQQVEKALEILSEVDGQHIDEGMVNRWLERVYTDEIAAQWQQLYDDKHREFEAVLKDMRPFESNEELEDQFNKLFDGAEVLPEESLEEYERRLEDKDKGLLSALGLLVPIAQRDLARLFKAGKVSPETDSRKHRILVVDVPYSKEYGLDLRTALAKEAPLEAD